MPNCKNSIQNFGPSSKERRSEEARKRIRLFMVFHSMSVDEGKAPIQVGYTRDISTRGVYFYTPTSVSAEEDVTMTIYVPASPDGELPPRLETKGKVTRVEQIEEREHYALNGVAVRYFEQVRIMV